MDDQGRLSQSDKMKGKEKSKQNSEKFKERYETEEHNLLL